MMANPFGTAAMAAGYASARPPVHRRVLQEAWERLGRREAFPVAVDIGCGAGVSTRALDGMARRIVGLEPALPMLQWASQTAPSAAFAAARAEALPLRGESADLMTAAGSLNYADLDRFFPEAVRVLRPGGVLVVYDFAPGRSFEDSPALDDWFSRFQARYPPPVAEARALDPATLARAAAGFGVADSHEFAIPVALQASFYLEYMLTETNVASAVRGGVPPGEIRSWCEETLAEVWPRGERAVVFRGYWVALVPGLR